MIDARSVIAAAGADYDRLVPDIHRSVRRDRAEDDARYRSVAVATVALDRGT
jgi:hypothetical protein